MWKCSKSISKPVKQVVIHTMILPPNLIGLIGCLSSTCKSVALCVKNQIPFSIKNWRDFLLHGQTVIATLEPACEGNQWDSRSALARQSSSSAASFSSWPSSDAAELALKMVKPSFGSTSVPHCGIVSWVVSSFIFVGNVISVKFSFINGGFVSSGLYKFEQTHRQLN